MRIFVFFAVTSPLFFLHEAGAEFECTSDVSFKVAQAQAKPEDKAAEAAAVAPSGEGREVFYAGISSRGADEEAAKNELKKKIDVSKEKAMTQCRAMYENRSSCIATKYSSMESVINTLDFKARAELQKAIRSDCDKQAGACVEATATDAKCTQVAAAADAAEGAKPEGEEAAKGAEAGKEAKGGGEKKKEEKKK